MAYPYTVTGTKEFLTYLIDKGLLNTNTGGGMKSACEKVFSVLNDDEKQNLQELDVDTLVRRFANKNPGVLSPDSLGVYSSRVRKALELLEKFNLNPANFKVSDIQKNKPADVANGVKKVPVKRKSSSEKLVTKNEGEQVTIVPPDSIHKSNAVTLMFPLRPDFIAQFVMPKDLSLREAKKRLYVKYRG